MKKLFGTDGIRARAGHFPVDVETIPAIGQAIGERLGGPVLVGRDPRQSSPWIFELLRAGLETSGAKVEDAGVIPTPAIALLTQQTEARGGVMISASHNAFEDNGIKVFGPDGRKLPDAAEAEIEERVRELQPAKSEPPSDRRADSTRKQTATSTSASTVRYTELLRERFPDGRWLEGFRIMADCANGAMSSVAPALLETLGAEVTTIHSSPSGRNINASCGAVHPASLIEHVGQDHPDLGVAYDGDGDRSMFVSSSGRLIDGDAVLLVMARLLKKAGNLTRPIVVGTSMTNYRLERILRREGIELVRVDVGDRYVFQEMSSSGAELGGEPSGHIIFSDYRLSGDGLLTTLKLCEVMVEEQSSIDALTEDWEPAPQLLRNIPVTEKIPLDTLPKVRQKIDEIARALEDRGRIVVRYSGTEPLLRVMIESDSAETNDTYAEELISVVRTALAPRL